MNEQSSAKAQCLCKSVSLTVSTMKNEVSACHCNMCRKWGGGPLMVVECDNKITIGRPECVKNYQSSSWAERGFCSQCGTHLYYHLLKQDLYFIPVGLFDSLQGIAFSCQVFIDEKPDYYSFAEVTHNLTGKELFEMFSGS